MFLFIDRVYDLKSLFQNALSEYSTVDWPGNRVVMRRVKWSGDADPSYIHAHNIRLLDADGKEIKWPFQSHEEILNEFLKLPDSSVIQDKLEGR